MLPAPGAAAEGTSWRASPSAVWPRARWSAASSGRGREGPSERRATDSTLCHTRHAACGNSIPCPETVVNTRELAFPPRLSSPWRLPSHLVTSV